MTIVIRNETEWSEFIDAANTQDEYAVIADQSEFVEGAPKSYPFILKTYALQDQRLCVVSLVYKNDAQQLMGSDDNELEGYTYEEA